MQVQFYLHPNFPNTANVIVNSEETKFAVRKDCYDFYRIEYWYKGEYRAFNSSWYCSQSKEEIKEKLIEIVGKKVKIDVFSRKGLLRIA